MSLVEESESASKPVVSPFSWIDSWYVHILAGLPTLLFGAWGAWIWANLSNGVDEVPPAGLAINTSLTIGETKGTFLDYRVVNTSISKLEGKVTLEIVVHDEYDDAIKSFKSGLKYGTQGVATVDCVYENDITRITVSAKHDNSDVHLGPGRQFGIWMIKPGDESWLPQSVFLKTAKGDAIDVKSTNLAPTVQFSPMGKFLTAGIFWGVAGAWLLAYGLFVVYRKTMEKTARLIPTLATSMGQEIGSAISRACSEAVFQLIVDRQTDLAEQVESMPQKPENPPTPQKKRPSRGGSRTAGERKSP